MASKRSSARQRLLQALYGVVQNQPWLKRLAVRLVMWFPHWGGQVMARVGTPVSRGGAVERRPVDAEASRRYRLGGYRMLLLPHVPLPAVPPARQLLVDLSGLVQRDARTGIQRVVRNLTRALAETDLPGWRVEPIYVCQGEFRYARRFVTADWHLPAVAEVDDVITARAGDVFFTADLALLPIAQMEAPLRRLRQSGVGVHFVLHDLIPVTHPEFYQGEVDPRFARWLDIVLQQADSVLCVSAAVADDLTRLVRREPPTRTDGGPRITWFHLGADLPAWQRPAAPDPATRRALHLSDSGAATRQFLMVGTLEPRKGHAQVLDAFEQLWAAGEDVALVLIGKVGWNVRALVERMRHHAQVGRRLCWLDNASDAVLHEAYAASHALIAASYTEGFGLPLIEAAQHDLPVIARDIPVFREVGGGQAFYFQAADGAALARALQHWLRLDADGRAPGSAGMPFLTWSQSARQVVRAIVPDAE